MAKVSPAMKKFSNITKAFIQEIRTVKVGEDKTFWIKDLPIHLQSNSVQLVCLNEPNAHVVESK